MKIEEIKKLHENAVTSEDMSLVCEHIDALLDVAEAAKAVCFSPFLLSDKTAMIMRMGELHAAIAKLEVVDETQK